MDDPKYLSNKKDKTPAYLLWFFGGWHYAYVRKWTWQLMLTVCLWSLPVSTLLLSLGDAMATIWVISLFASAVGGLWWFLDLFNVGSYVNDYNAKLLEQIKKERASEDALVG